MPETKRARLMLIAVTVITLFGFGGLGATPSTGKQTTDQQRSRAPDFSLTGIYGQKVQLASYRGKVVVVDFWAIWCKSCGTEIPRFIDLEKKYRSEGFQIIGISMDDDAEPVRDFYKRFGMNYPVAMADEKVGALYGGVVGLPTTFLIGRDGRIYDRVLGAIVDFEHFREQIEALLAVKGRSSAMRSKAKSTGLASAP
jgi:cytochrome c biogenesis protein CcmG, thiol:disulfide interchange protein DsbE